MLNRYFFAPPDAETAARSVLSGIATAVPKTADGASEMVRQIKIARDTAVKARSAAIITLKTLIVNAPGELREALEPLTDRKLIDRCAALKPGQIVDPTASVKHALRALAARWLSLAAEIGDHDEALDTITLAAAPTLRPTPSPESEFRPALLRPAILLYSPPSSTPIRIKISLSRDCRDRLDL